MLVGIVNMNRFGEPEHLYKNAIMTQWHPDRTTDGILLIRDWLEN